MRSINFDYNATTPLDPQVREAMLPYLGEIYGNPSSVHHVGRRARSLLDDARDRVAQVWRCKPSEVAFTSGGTESTNLAIFGAARRFRDKGRHIITTAIEHHAVLHPCEYLVNKEGFEVTFLPVDQAGKVSVSAVKAAIRPDTVLVSVMAANNEIGTIEPVAEIGPIWDRLVNAIAFTVANSNGISLLAGLDLEGICASSGSACSAGSLEPSHVMTAIGVPKNEANALVRFSLGRESSLEEVDALCDALPRVISRVQQFQ